MLQNQKPVKTLIGAAFSAIIASQVSFAGSFSLYTESRGAAVGNYAAGIAAEAADASTGWYNPAGLSLLHTSQVVFGGIGVFPNSEVTGSSRFTTTGLSDYNQNFTSLSGGESALVPSFHYAKPLSEKLTFGLSVLVPFGLSTQWSASGPVRYQATDSELFTVNLSPEIGARISQHMAVGLGVDVQYAKVKFNQVLGSPTYLQALNEAGIPISTRYFDSLSNNRGDSVALGFHAGILALFNQDHTRIGLNYQSEMEHKFHGTSSLTGVLASPDLNIADPDSIASANANAVYRNGNLSSNEIKLPSITTLSGYHDINERLALLASVVYTNWHSFQSIRLDNVAAYVPGIGQTNVNSASVSNYHDTWRFAAGANYKVNEQWMVRVGGGYDQTPTNDQDRDIRIADSNRWALSIGTHYQVRPTIGVDVGYTHLFSTGDVPISVTKDAGVESTYTVDARASGYADLVGAQFTWTLD